jgi:AraC-like DNA-binding protein
MKICCLYQYVTILSFVFRNNHMEGFSNIIHYIIVAEVALVSMLLYILALIKKGHKANRILSLFIISVSSPLLISVFSRLLPSLGGILFCFSVAFTSVSGAFVYLYIASLSGRLKKSGLREILLFAPFPIFFIAISSVILPYSIVDGRPSFSRAIAFIAVASTVVSTIYIFFCSLNIRRYSLNIENWFSDTEKVSILWLKKITVLSLMLFLLWDISFGVEVFGFVKWTKSFIPIPHLSLIAVIIVITTYHIIRQPDIFRADSDIDMAMGSSDTEESDGQVKVKYAKQSIDAETQKRCLATLLNYMEKEKPFLDEDVTIRKISESVDIPIHHLSIVINSLCGKNFALFINEYRVREALEMLSHEDSLEVNILSVAFRSGFSSKSSFNNAFKKITGKTPSEYRSAIAS